MNIYLNRQYSSTNEFWKAVNHHVKMFNDYAKMDKSLRDDFPPPEGETRPLKAPQYKIVGGLVFCGVHPRNVPSISFNPEFVNNEYGRIDVEVEEEESKKREIISFIYPMAKQASIEIPMKLTEKEVTIDTVVKTCHDYFVGLDVTYPKEIFTKYQYVSALGQESLRKLKLMFSPTSPFYSQFHVFVKFE